MTSYPNYENTIEEHDETAVNDDSDSGIDSLYECIKFKTNDNHQQQTAPGPDFYSLDNFCFTLLLVNLSQPEPVSLPSSAKLYRIGLAVPAYQRPR